MARTLIDDLERTSTARRFRGFEALPVLVAALKKLQPTIDADQKAA